MENMRREITNGKRDISQFRDKNGNLVTDRDTLLHTVEQFYKTI